MKRIILLILSCFLLPFNANAQAIAKDENLQKKAANLGYQQSMGFTPKQLWEDEKLLHNLLMGLKPNDEKKADVYLVVAALDSDAVFGREAIEVTKILEKKYNARGRTIILSSGDDERNQTPEGTPDNLAKTIARLGEIMDAQNDILIVYLTTHGHPITGLAYKNKGYATGSIGTERLKTILNEGGIKNQMIMLSACFSGIFIPELASDERVIVTAAAADRASFGCKPDNDWTFFGDAMINHAMRKDIEFKLAFQDARNTINAWEKKARLKSSNPQISIGEKSNWLNFLEKNAPKDLGSPSGKSFYDLDLGAN